jgi:XTP/dITP diphosphohydrolase
VSGRRLLLATRSRHKLDELRQLLELPGIDLVSPDEAGVEGEPVEDAPTFSGNADIKARFYASRSGLPTLADDSGLEVDALDGGPGVRTKRYAGGDASDSDNNRKLLGELSGVPAEQRGARYVCVLAFLDPTTRGAIQFREGTFDGRIAESSRGHGGFGYDPLFEAVDEPVGGRTVGQMTVAEKHMRSHRGKAARSMSEYLRTAGW